MKSEIKLRFKTATDLALVRKAAKSDGRSMNQFIARAAVDAAKASLAMLKLPSYAPPGDQDREAT